VTIRGQRQKRIGNRGSWGRYRYAICGAGVVRRHEIGEIKKRKRKEQKE